MAERRFGGSIRVYGEVLAETQGTGPTSVVTRQLLDAVQAFVTDRAHHTGTQTFATISDGASILDARIQAVVGAAPAALDTLGEIAARLADDSQAASALTNTVTGIRTDLTAVTTRVTTLETSFGTLRADVDTNTGAITALRADVDAVTTSAAGTALAVSTLTGRVDTLRTDVDALTGTTGGLASQDDLDALDTRVDTAESNISTLRTDVDATTAKANAAATQTALTEVSDRVTALERVTVFKATVGDGTATSFTVTHGLGTKDVEVIVYDVNDGQTVLPVITRTSDNAVSVDFGTYVPTTSSQRVIVKKF